MHANALKRKNALFAGFLFLLFSIAAYVVSERIIERTVRQRLWEKTGRLIAQSKDAADPKEFIQAVRRDESLAFFRVALFDALGRLLWDSHRGISKIDMNVLPEVKRALAGGPGYKEHRLSASREWFACEAILFQLGEQDAVLWVAMPFQEMRDTVRNIGIGLLILGGGIFGIYGVVSWRALKDLNAPIRRISAAIEGYREGQEDLPRIEMTQEIKSERDFLRFAEIINHLSSKVRQQIHALLSHKNETEAILNILEEGIIAVGGDGAVKFMNPSARKMLRLSDAQIVGYKLEDLLSQRSPLLSKCQKLIALATQTGMKQTAAIHLEEALPSYFEMIAGPFGECGAAILVLKDKTADYQMIEMGKDFIANTSHELRTPITVIRGFAETLHEEHALPPETIKEVTGKILKTSIRLESLVKSLLMLSNIEMIEDLPSTPVNLVSIAERSIKMLAAAHPSAKISFSRGCDEAMIPGDFDLVEMALMNLLENAAKYSPTPARIDLAIEKTETCVQVNVKDRGIGIPSAALSRIFDRFYTVDKARSRKLGGAGLGLSIVKTVMAKHRGEVTVSSKIGHGSTFSMIFPLHRK